MSDVAEALGRLGALNEVEFAQLERLILRTYSLDARRRESIAAAVTCANLVASTDVVRIRIAKILRLLALVDQRTANAESSSVATHAPPPPQ
jgi:hypothetical protein